jgi:serine/threonine protein phosphatase PrpC
MMETPQLTCPGCQAPLEEADRFCERCGARLGEPEPGDLGCPLCGAPTSAIDADGFCSACGTRERRASDRVERDLVTAAAVSDRGRVHRRNEDAFHLELLAGGEVAVVVCDGISSASAPDTAARCAAETAGRTLADSIAAGEPDAGVAVSAAIDAARSSVDAVAWTTRVDRSAPSCTLVSALCKGTEIVIGSVGDSRAYWIDASGSLQLTVDESWAEEQVADGRMTVEQAMQDPRSHAITNWVGPGSPERPTQIAVLTPDTPGRLLLCTDGLWNYMASDDELTELVMALPAEASPAAVARALTETAIARGGRDNITVAVVDIDPDRSMQ